MCAHQPPASWIYITKSPYRWTGRARRAGRTGLAGRRRDADGLWIRDSIFPPPQSPNAIGRLGNTVCFLQDYKVNRKKRGCWCVLTGFKFSHLSENLFRDAPEFVQ